MKTRAIKVYLGFVVIGTVGCSTMNTVSKETQPKDNSDAIHVILVDNREIDFEPGEYSISRGADSSFIEGVGRIVGKTDGDTAQYVGRIGFQEIKELQITGPSALTQVGTAAGVHVLIFGALMIIVAAGTTPWH